MQQYIQLYFVIGTLLAIPLCFGYIVECTRTKSWRVVDAIATVLAAGGVIASWPLFLLFTMYGAGVSVAYSGRWRKGG